MNESLDSRHLLKWMWQDQAVDRKQIAKQIHTEAQQHLTCSMPLRAQPMNESLCLWYVNSASEVASRILCASAQSKVQPVPVCVYCLCDV